MIKEEERGVRREWLVIVVLVFKLVGFGFLGRREKVGL